MSTDDAGDPPQDHMQFVIQFVKSLCENSNLL